MKFFSLHFLIKDNKTFFQCITQISLMWLVSSNAKLAFDQLHNYLRFQCMLWKNIYDLGPKYVIKEILKKLKRIWKKKFSGYLSWTSCLNFNFHLKMSVWDKNFVKEQIELYTHRYISAAFELYIPFRNIKVTQKYQILSLNMSNRIKRNNNRASSVAIDTKSSKVVPKIFCCWQNKSTGGLEYFNYFVMTKCVRWLRFTFCKL